MTLDPLETLQTLLALGLWVLGSGILFLLVTAFLALAWGIVKSVVDDDSKDDR